MRSAPKGLAAGLLALAAVLAFLLRESLFLGKFLMPLDGLALFPPWRGAGPPSASNALLVDQFLLLIPQQHFFHEWLIRGSFPLWNPGLACGLPSLASMQPAALSPLQFPLFFLHPGRAAGLAAFLKLLLAGSSMILYMRSLGVHRSAALLSGLMFALSGFMVSWVSFAMGNCAAYLPLLFFLLERQLRPGAGRKGWAGLSLAYGCMILGGHPPTIIHVTLMLLAYFLFRDRSAAPWKSRNAAFLAASLAVGAALAGPQLLPYLEYAREGSTSAAAKSLQRGAIRSSPATLLHFLLPYASGGPGRGYERLEAPLQLGPEDNFHERTGYVGILGLFLALAAAALRRDPATRFHLGLLLACAGAVYGLPPLPWLLSRLPLLSAINHHRLLLGIGFAASALAGLGLDAWDTFKPRKTVPLAAAFLVGAVAVAGLFWRKLSGFDLGESETAFLLLQFSKLGAGLALAAALCRIKTAGAARRLAVAWTAADLLLFASGVNPAASPSEYYPRTPAIDRLMRQSGTFRLLGLGPALPPNTAVLFGLQDARGVDFTAVRRYEELIREGEGFSHYFFATADRPPAALPLLNARYLLTEKDRAPVVPYGPRRLERVYSGEIDIYRDKAALERAELVFAHEIAPDRRAALARVRSPDFDPRRAVVLEEEPGPPPPSSGPPSQHDSAQVTRYAPEEVVVEARLSRPGFLLLLDTYFPGWEARLDGRPVRIHRADYNFRAVSMPAGAHSVRFSYEPVSYKLGWALSLAALALLSLVSFRERR